MGFSRQECWSGLPFPSPGDLPDPGVKPWSPILQADALPSEPQGSPNVSYTVAQIVKNLPAMPEVWVRLGRSPGERNGNPLQYSCLKNSTDRGAWWATVHGVTKSQTRLRQLSTHTHVNMHATSSLAIYLSMDTKIASVS